MAFPEPSCAVCGRTLTIRQRLVGDLCGDMRCYDARLYEQLQAHRDEAAAALNEPEPAGFRIIVIPVTDRHVTPLPAERRRAFRRHLAQVVREAFRRRRDERAASARTTAVPADGAAQTTVRKVTNDQSAMSDASATSGTLGIGACALDISKPAAVWPSLPETHEAVLGRICAACEGYCCSHGGTHAFLEDDRILRHLIEHPHDRPRDVMRRYFSHIPEQTYNDACVYQGAAGCTLPGAMRADICNEYHCPGLKAMRQHLTDHAGDDDPAHRRCCAVARRDNKIHRSAFVDDVGVRRYSGLRREV